jgi:uncharacterized protein (TIGR02284 family)
METEKAEVSTELNKLVTINNDRIEGYERAANETKDSELKQLFTKFASQSRRFNNELSTEVRNAGGTVETGTTTSGKFYRAWMDIKAAISGKDRKAILASCEFGEDVAKDTYKEILEDNHLPVNVKTLVNSQFNEITSAHDEVRRLRDSI